MTANHKAYILTQHFCWKGKKNSKRRWSPQTDSFKRKVNRSSRTPSWVGSIADRGPADNARKWHQQWFIRMFCAVLWCFVWVGVFKQNGSLVWAWVGFVFGIWAWVGFVFAISLWGPLWIVCGWLCCSCDRNMFGLQIFESFFVFVGLCNPKSGSATEHLCAWAKYTVWPELRRMSHVPNIISKSEWGRLHVWTVKKASCC